MHIGVEPSSTKQILICRHPSLRAMVTVLSVALTGSRSPVRCVISPPVTAPGSPLLAREHEPRLVVEIAQADRPGIAPRVRPPSRTKKRWMAPEHSEPVWRRRSGADLVSHSG